MNTELEQIKQELNTLKTENARIQRQFHTAQRRLRIQAGLAFSALMGAALLAPASRTAIAQGYGLTLASLNTRLLVVENKTQYMSVDATAKSVTFSGCNLIVNDGSGSTDKIVTNAAGQGLGNLIIGYNASRVVVNDTDMRTGSHNLIVGDGSNYSAYGGIVAGHENAIIGPYACVTGGYYNTASGAHSSVSGGYIDHAIGPYSSISGGYFNEATGDTASISGGGANTASGEGSSVSGGLDNTAKGYVSAASGGIDTTARDDYSWAAGSYHSP